MRAPARANVHGLIGSEYFGQVQEREKYGGGMERENETGNSQHGRELFLVLYTTGHNSKYLAAAVTPPAA
jgi:hypothetical protein